MRAVSIQNGSLVFDPKHPEASQPTSAPEPCVPVQVRLAGICETDLQLVKGYMGFQGILGHEFVGIAKEGKFEGKRVVGEINCSCHRCEMCLAGHANHCPNRSVIGILNHDGAFADTVFVPEKNLHLVPDSVPDSVAVFTEPLAAAFQIPAQLDLSKFRNAVVVGDGRLGYLIAQVLKQEIEEVTVAGKHDSKLNRFHNFGIKIINIGSGKLERVFDIAVDCTGSPTGIPTAINFVKPRGTLVLKTTVADEFPTNLASVVIDEIQVVGSRCGPFDRALAALEKNQIEVQSLITERFPIEDAVTAFSAAQSPDHQKVLLEF